MRGGPRPRAARPRDVARRASPSAAPCPRVHVRRRRPLCPPERRREVPGRRASHRRAPVGQDRRAPRLRGDRLRPAVRTPALPHTASRLPARAVATPPGLDRLQFRGATLHRSRHGSHDQLHGPVHRGAPGGAHPGRAGRPPALARHRGGLHGRAGGRRPRERRRASRFPPGARHRRVLRGLPGPDPARRGDRPSGDDGGLQRAGRHGLDDPARALPLDHAQLLDPAGTPPQHGSDRRPRALPGRARVHVGACSRWSPPSTTSSSSGQHRPGTSSSATCPVPSSGSGLR